MTQQDTQPPAETLGPLWRKVQQVQNDAMRDDVTPDEYRARMIAALTRRAGGDAIPAGEVEAFRRGAEAMQRKLADALRDHLNSRAAAIANAVAIPEYQA